MATLDLGDHLGKALHSCIVVQQGHWVRKFAPRSLAHPQSTRAANEGRQIKSWDLPPADVQIILYNLIDLFNSESKPNLIATLFHSNPESFPHDRDAARHRGSNTQLHYHAATRPFSSIQSSSRLRRTRKCSCAEISLGTRSGKSTSQSTHGPFEIRTQHFSNHWASPFRHVFAQSIQRRRKNARGPLENHYRKPRRVKEEEVDL